MVSFRYRRKYSASPFFQKTNSAAIAANGYWIFHWEDTAAAKKYLPFNLVMVTNSSNYGIRFYPNQGSRYMVIPANSTKTFDKTSLPNFYSGKIYNIDSSNAIAANLISVETQREQYVTSDVISSIHKVLRGY